MSKKFILNDGKKINSYGFRVRNSGIDMSRFATNPVMLDEHWALNRYVLGRWTDIRTEGDLLTAAADFDKADGEAKRIAGKVERGYIKGASIGVLYQPEDMQLQPDGVYELLKCELLEASICAIPSNANAIRLYASAEGQPLTGEQIKLSMASLSTVVIHPQKENNNNTMSKIVLSIAALAALGLDKTVANAADGIDEAQLNAGIADLKASLDSAEQSLSTTKMALQTLQDATAKQKRLAAEKIVDDAISAGKIDATAKDAWLKLATDNEALASSTLAALPAKKSLAGQVNNPAPVPTGEVKTMDDFQKLSHPAQLAFKNDSPEAYKKLFS